MESDLIGQGKDSHTSCVFAMVFVSLPCQVKGTEYIGTSVCRALHVNLIGTVFDTISLTFPFMKRLRNEKTFTVVRNRSSLD